MSASAEQLALDLVAQIRDEKSLHLEELARLNSRLNEQVAVNVKLTLDVGRLTQQIRVLMREANGSQ